MKKILQINVSVNTGSTGRITEDIANTAIAAGYESYIAYGRTNNGSRSKVIRIGNEMDLMIHLLYSRLFDKHGLASKRATKKLIQHIEKIQPDIVHLHNLHGYYLNYEILFHYLNEWNIPVVWTFHDCWPVTGHCSHFDAVNCSKWQTGCHICPNKKGYPTCLFVDNSKNNYAIKKKMFAACNHLTIITPSEWLANIVKFSFLRNRELMTIHNGVDINVFQPVSSTEILRHYAIPDNKFMILGVAGIWHKRKGLDDFIHISQCIDDSIIIVLIGLNKRQQNDLPKNIKGISRMENINELAQLYAASSVFVNPTRIDNFPTTNLEALACGTPVITYHTGGSPESVSEDTGFVVEKGDVTGLLQAINQVKTLGKACFSEQCRQRAVDLYDNKKQYAEYIKLYDSLLCKSS